MSARVVVTALLACAALASGCYTARADLPGTLRNDVAEKDLEVVGKLEVERAHTFFLHGAVGEPPRDFLAKEIAKQVQARGADGVARVVYSSQQGCGDVALTACTLGCFAPRTFRVTGDIVRIRAARLPGRPAKLVDTKANEPHDGVLGDDVARLAQRF